MRTFATFVSVLLTVSLGGCARTAIKPSGQMIPPYYKPLSGWDQEILAKYNAGSLENYVAQEMKQMGFLQAYHEEFPEPYRAIAYVSAKAQRTYDEWDAAEKEALAAKARLRTARKRLADQQAIVNHTNLDTATGLAAADAVAAREKLATLEVALTSAQDDFNEKSRLKSLGESAYYSAHFELKSTLLAARVAAELALTNVTALPTGPNNDIRAKRREKLTQVTRIVAALAPDKPSEASVGPNVGDQQIAGPETRTDKDAAAKTSPQALNELWNSIAGETNTELDSFGLPMEREMALRRNEILSELMVLAEAVHDARDHQLFFTRESGNVFFDTIQIAATGVASVTGSQHAARSLSAFATGLAGIQESFDKRLFFQQTTVLLLQLMQADRDAKEGILLVGMTKPVDQYPLEKGLDDYAAFLTAGGLVDAIKKLSEEAAMKSREANQNLEKLRNQVIENKTRLQQEQEKKEAEKAADKQKLFDLLDQVLSSGTGTAPAGE